MLKGFEIARLPLYKDNYAGPKDIVSRSINYKGELTVLTNQKTNYIAYINFRENVEPRGNHYHKSKMEYVYLCKGKIRGYFRNHNDINENNKTVDIDEGSLITIYPGCTHTFETVEEGYAIEFSPTSYSLIKGDVVRDIIK